MAGGAGVSAGVVSKGSEAAALVKGSPGSAPSLISGTSLVSALGLGSATKVRVWFRINIVTVIQSVRSGPGDSATPGPGC